MEEGWVSALHFHNILHVARGLAACKWRKKLRKLTWEFQRLSVEKRLDECGVNEEQQEKRVPAHSTHNTRARTCT